MADPANSSPFQAVQNAIYTTLESEMASGRLHGVSAVGDTWLNEVDEYPYVYVDFDGFDQDLGDAVRQRKQTLRFIMGIAYESNVSLSDARKNVKNLLDDGNGNGLCPILNDPANFHWGQSVNWTSITNCKIYDNGDKNQNTTGQFVAYAVLVYSVNLFMNLSGPLQ